MLFFYFYKNCFTPTQHPSHSDFEYNLPHRILCNQSLLLVQGEIALDLNSTCWMKCLDDSFSLLLVPMVKFCEKSHLFFRSVLVGPPRPLPQPPTPSLSPASLSMILSSRRGAALSVTHLSRLWFCPLVLHFFPLLCFPLCPQLYLPKSLILSPRLVPLLLLSVFGLISLFGSLSRECGVLMAP